MKKTIVITISALLMMSSFAFAVTSKEFTAGSKMTGQKDASSAAQPLGQLSNSVALTVAATATDFAAATTHVNGTKEYGSSNGDTKIYSKDKSDPKATKPGTDISAGDSSVFTSGWTSM
ncbi:MAG: hypothetical protein PHI31_13350 [Desulfuromonadaceae bacterium]|nr:hypothetical protein [Desulfuromonadaceae bacterium]